MIETGWGWPRGSRKAHYFRDTMALCRRYGFYRGPLADRDKLFSPSVNHCQACNKILAKTFGVDELRAQT